MQSDTPIRTECRISEGFIYSSDNRREMGEGKMKSVTKCVSYTSKLIMKPPASMGEKNQKNGGKLWSDKDLFCLSWRGSLLQTLECYSTYSLARLTLEHSERKML